MNPTTLSIGHTYLYNTNRGVIIVNYIGPFPALPGGNWHDFRIQNDYQDETLTISALSIDNGDLLPLIVESEFSPEEKKIPEPVSPDIPAPAYMESKSILKVRPIENTDKPFDYNLIKIKGNLTPELENAKLKIGDVISFWNAPDNNGALFLKLKGPIDRCIIYPDNYDVIKDNGKVRINIFADLPD